MRPVWKTTSVVWSTGVEISADSAGLMTDDTSGQKDEEPEETDDWSERSDDSPEPVGEESAEGVETSPELETSSETLGEEDPGEEGTTELSSSKRTCLVSTTLFLGDKRQYTPY